MSYRATYFANRRIIKDASCAGGGRLLNSTIANWYAERRYRPLVASWRKAMGAADFDFASCGAVTSIPAFLSSLNATFTRASVKNVLQGASLVQLAANQFGTTKDPSNDLYGLQIEPAATNLALYSESAVVNWGAAGVTNAASTFFGATNAFYFVNNAIADRSIKQALSVTSGTTYTISAYVIMDDLSVPVVGTTVSTGDFLLLGDATVITSAALVESCGGNIYRVSASVTAAGTASRLFGIYKESTQSAKGFRVTRIQVETGNIATSYIATTSATVTRAAAKLVVPVWKNNLKYSTDPTGTGWARTNTTLTSGQSDPFGGTTAWKAEATTTATTNFYSSGTIAVSTTMTASVYVYAGATASGQINFILRNGSTATNFTQGTFTNATGAISGAGWTSTAVPGYAGWYRLTFTQATGINVGDSLNFQIGFTTTCTAGDWFRYCAPQIQPGSTATTYIPTTSTLDVTGNANIPGFSSAGYTLVADLRLPVVPTDVTARRVIEIGDGTTANFCHLAHYSDKMYAEATASSVAQSSTIIKNPYGAVRHKNAVSTTTNSQLSAVDGTAATADTSLTMPAALTILAIGSSAAGSFPIGGCIYRAQLIPKALTQAQLNGLTQ